jgi:DNA mismatch repair protein MutS2
VRRKQVELRERAGAAAAEPAAGEEAAGADEVAASAPGVRLPSGESPGLELDLRGQTADEALHRLDQYLDDAYLVGLPWVRIIHGKGTGVLRSAVRDALREHPLVTSYESGGEREGGDGVTVAKLAVE